jgi:hypothetical protein
MKIMFALILMTASAIAVLVGVAPAAHASPTVILLNPQVASEIEGLVVDGATYNVIFQLVTSEPTFQGNSAGALDAANAIDTALNATTASFVSIGLSLNDFISINNFDVLDDGSIGVLGANLNSVAGAWAILSTSTPASTYGSVAVFTPVPAPPIGRLRDFLVIGGALLGVRLLGRGRRRGLPRTHIA